MTELSKGKIKKISVGEKEISVILEKEFRMKPDFLRLRYRSLNDAVRRLGLEIERIKEIAKQAKIKLE